jgi:2-polyprenyl-6-methoxyphenol hydroxylase-like FAD-dependent oxidoreductase
MAADVETDVLIIGAGPTGLVLALWLSHLGARVRIIDKAAEPGTTSRALAVQARTLELYDQLGLGRTMFERSRPALAANLWVTGKRRAHIAFGNLGAGVSPYPFPVIFPQDEHELLLIEQLWQVGVQVERPAELLDIELTDRVIARIKRSDGTNETCWAAYIAGCDGAHSKVRELLKIGFAGGTYEHLFYVADVEATGSLMNGELHVGLDKSDFLALFPLKDAGRVRLVGTVSDHALTQRKALTWDDVNTNVMQWMPIKIARVNWFSTYHVHHRVANQFRKGCAFLLGDAAHIHSPVGGQGMNTGIGDAINLAWKLAGIRQGRAHKSILESYEPERITFAQRLVKSTDQAFTAVTSSGPIARFVRLDLVPVLLPALFSFRPMARLFFGTVSQTKLNYRGSPLSGAGKVGRVHSGDRLPWVEIGDADNFAPLTSLDWQVHVYGEAANNLQKICTDRGLPLHSFPWHADMTRAGLRRNAAYLLRPDGYIACAELPSGAGRIADYLEAHHIVSRAAPTAPKVLPCSPKTLGSPDSCEKSARGPQS